jgi:hypothetical protein
VEVSFDLKPGLGAGEAAARKFDGVPRPEADAAITPTTTIAPAAAEAISNVRPLFIEASSETKLKVGLESRESLRPR